MALQSINNVIPTPGAINAPGLVNVSYDVTGDDDTPVTLTYSVSPDGVTISDANGNPMRPNNIIIRGGTMSFDDDIQVTWDPAGGLTECVIYIHGEDHFDGGIMGAHCYIAFN